MADAIKVQSNFLGGHWAPTMQGRADLPQYATGMNVCYNALPIEQGSWTRRPGSRYAGPTRSGNAARVLPFPVQESAPYIMEFTAGYLRLWSGARGYFDVATNSSANVTSISTADPAVMTLSAPVGWATGQMIKFLYVPGTSSAESAVLQNRQFSITKLTTSTFELFDAVTGAAIDGAAVNFLAAGDLLAILILEFAAPYEVDDLQALYAIEGNNNGSADAIILDGEDAPQVLTNTILPSSGKDGTFTFAPITFQDGPYFDPIPNTTATVHYSGGGATIPNTFSVSISAQTWTTTSPVNTGDLWLATDGAAIYVAGQPTINVAPPLVAAAGDGVNWIGPLAGGAAVNYGQPAYLNGLTGFQASDIGRMLRIYLQPPDYSSASSYTAGNVVTYNGLQYTALNPTGGGSFSGVEPDSDLSLWSVNTSSAGWIWVIVTAIVSAGEVTVILGADQTIPGPGLYATGEIFNTVQIGLYSDTTGWPTCGAYYQGRLWLGGVIPNRFDASVSDDIFTFSPTQPDGTVADNNAVSEVLNASGQNVALWMEPDHQGMIVGTQEGEWLIQASQLNDPITPTSIQSYRATKYGVSAARPARTGLTMTFVQKFKRKLLEYFPDVFTGRFLAPNLSEAAPDLTITNILEIGYQDELAPVVWGRTGSGSLIGATYKRESLMSSTPPKFVGWHNHALGSGYPVTGLAVGPSVDGTLDTVCMVTQNGSVYNVETLTDILDPNLPITGAWFVDCAVVPGANGARGGTLQTVGGVSTLTLYGLWHLNGSKVSAWVGAVDLGDYTVASGSIAIPLSVSPNALMNAAALRALNGGSYGQLATVIDDLDHPGVTLTIPAVVGFTYSSQGQILRALPQQEAKTQTGPALGMTRRTHMYSFLLQGTQGLSVGTKFDSSMVTVPLNANTKDNSGTALPLNQLKSGVVWGTLNDGYGFDSMLARQVTRPYPATVCMAGAFQNIQER